MSPARCPLPFTRLSPLTFTLRCTLLGMAVEGTSLLLEGSAQAQPASSSIRAVTRLDDTTLRTYDIPAGPLGAALGSFASQSGLLLSFAPELARNRNAPALKGRYTVQDGLRQLLSNTALQVVEGSSGSYLLVAPGQTVDLTAELSPTVVSADHLEKQKQPYRAPSSSVYLSSEDLERFGRVSPGDLLRGVAGVQVGDSRNGGALDANIRGVQGQRRVAIQVDGAEQALAVYRGYAGTQQRSYIDPDLISSVTVNKGPSTTSGAIGGTVQMQTIGVDDILLDGQDVGLRLTGDVWNNGVAPAHRSSTSKQEQLETAPHDKRGSLFGSQAESGSAAFAFRNERLDVVAAYAKRNQGNYFAGEHGQDRYRQYDEDGYEQPTVAGVYNAGE